MQPLRAAVVGTGFIGPVHVEGLRRAGVEVVGILGSEPGRSAAAAEQLGLSKAYRHYDELLADNSIDSVHLATPNRLHFDQARQALASGKHVMCEKPLAMNSQESAELVRLARGSNLAAGVNYNIRYYPICLEAAERVRSGALGRLFHVTGSYLQDWLLLESDFNWRVESAEGGLLRAVADIGTHWLDLVQFITGEEVTEVLADLHTVHPIRQKPVDRRGTFSQSSQAQSEPVRIETEDYGSILLKFAGGARGSLTVSQVSAGRKNCLRFDIAGANESLAWDSQRPDELWIGRRNEPNQQLLRDPGLLSPAARRHSDYPGGHAEGFPDTFKQCFRAFYNYIRAGDFRAPATFPTFADGHREIVLCEAVLQSARAGHWTKAGAAI